MKQFDLLVSEQLKTMDQLLNLQTELERYKSLKYLRERERDEESLRELRVEIQKRQQELHLLHQTFEQQTKQVIESFQQERSYT